MKNPSTVFNLLLLIVACTALYFIVCGNVELNQAESLTKAAGKHLETA